MKGQQLMGVTTWWRIQRGLRGWVAFATYNQTRDFAAAVLRAARAA